MLQRYRKLGVSPTEVWAVAVVADTTCSSGPVLGTASPYIGANAPFPVTPSGGYALPLNIAPGNYNVCARIGATAAIAETSELDNVIRSERLLNVHTCP